MSLTNVKNIVLVMSGKGGVGKSTVSVNLAFSLAEKNYSTGLMDIDLHGPSVAAMTGIENIPLEVTADQQMKPVHKYRNLHILSLASLLDHPDSPVIWRGPMKAGVIEQFINDVAWPSLDYLVVDCPPGTGDEVLSIIQLLKKVSGAIIVTTPQKIAYLDVRKSIKFAQKLGVPLLGFVENMASIQCPHCNQSVYLSDTLEASRTEKDFGIEMLARIPWDHQLVRQGDKGYHESDQAINAVADKVIEKLHHQPLNRQEVCQNSIDGDKLIKK